MLQNACCIPCVVAGKACNPPSDPFAVFRPPRLALADVTPARGTRSEGGMDGWRAPGQATSFYLAGCSCRAGRLRACGWLSSPCSTCTQCGLHPTAAPACIHPTDASTQPCSPAAHMPVHVRQLACRPPHTRSPCSCSACSCTPGWARGTRRRCLPPSPQPSAAPAGHSRTVGGHGGQAGLVAGLPFMQQWRHMNKALSAPFPQRAL